MNMNILYNNIFTENDAQGKDAYDYAREYLFEQYGEEEGWKEEAEVPDDRVFDQVYWEDEINWDDFRIEFNSFLKDSKNGFLLCGTVGRWDGTYRGGTYIQDFEDLYKFWDGCAYIKVYDERGHLFIEATHHDGTNFAELKELTNKGLEYKDTHRWTPDSEVHNTLFSSNFFTRLPHYAHKVWGCKKGA